jgi:carbonic anhydrase
LILAGDNLAATEALARLREGNARFARQEVSLQALLGHARRGELAHQSRPFAVILGCSDSRVPAEFVFDQGLGDLFVIRVAGNITAPSQIGSVEFAVERFGIRLVVVMGHSHCGAIDASLAQIREPTRVSRGMKSIVERISPTLEGLVQGCHWPNEETLLQAAVRANVRVSVSQLRHGSGLLERLHLTEELLIVGAEYSVESGEVEFLEQ